MSRVSRKDQDAAHQAGYDQQDPFGYAPQAAAAKPAPEIHEDHEVPKVQAAPETAIAKPTQPATTAAGTGPLGGLKLNDIAKALDQQTATRAWERYQRGDKAAFNRSLYSQEGAKTFDQIQNRYSNDPAFRETVNRYVSDFEKLLLQAAEKDRSGEILRTYLSSETGRVYMMLAHAAGRLA